MAGECLYEGQFLRLLRRGNWEFVQRTNASAVVVLVGLTRRRELLFVEQFRPPLGRDVLELPAGLVGDDQRDENLLTAAARELEEETGYRASALEVLDAGPPSAGLSDEVVTFVLALDCERVSAGGGVGDERIRTHAIALAEAPRWLAARRAQGLLLDPKLYIALWFATERARVTS